MPGGGLPAGLVAQIADGTDPAGLSAGSRRMVLWRCERGHEWRARVAQHARTGRCPFCSGRRVLAGFNDVGALFPGVAAQWVSAPGGVGPQDVRPGSQVVVLWRCGVCGHEWRAQVRSRTLGGSRCPVCPGARVVVGVNDVLSQRPRLAGEWARDLNGEVVPDRVAVGSHREVWWRCGRGHVWRAKVFLRARGTGCPECVEARGRVRGRVVPKTVLRQFAADLNPGVDPAGLTAGSQRRVWWRCGRGHTWQAEVRSRCQGSRCPYCVGSRVVVGVSDVASTHPWLVDEWVGAVGGGWTPYQVSAGSSRLVVWRCERGHEWRARVSDRASRGRGCPECRLTMGV